MRLRALFAMVLVVSSCLSWAGCAGASPARTQFFYLALGASDAVGVGAFPLTSGYVFRIKAELDKQFQEVTLLNVGVPGARVGLIQEQVRVSGQLGTKPHLVTLWTGSNDLVAGEDPRDFQADLQLILQTLRKGPWTVIVIANLPDLTQLPRFRENPSPVVTLSRVKAFNAAITEEAARAEVPVVDLFAEELSEMLVSDLDGFHPNNDGHREIARLFLRVILPSVGVK